MFPEVTIAQGLGLAALGLSVGTVGALAGVGGGFLLVPVLLFIFRYIPIYGIVIAFQDFRIGRGIMGSPFNNFAHFKNFFEGPFFFRLMRNTLVISFLKLGFGFPAPIILALLINELRNMSFKRTIQSVSYLPHFMSWVVLAGILIEVISCFSSSARSR